jgi:hypothetical protein
MDSEYKHIEPTKKPDHYFNAVLCLDGDTVANIPCKLYLPERTNEKPYLFMRPSQKESKKIQHLHHIELKGELSNLGGERTGYIVAPEVFLSGPRTSNWGGGITDTTLFGEPQDLEVSHQLKPETKPDNTSLVFWISSNQFLTPTMTSKMSYLGDLSYKRIENHSYSLTEGISVSVDRHFNNKSLDNGDLLQWSYLVATCELDSNGLDTAWIRNNILPYLDDLLLVASFLSRQRTVCLGWSASNECKHKTYYRGNYSFPKENSRDSLWGGVVEFAGFSKQVRRLYEGFEENINKLAVRNALYSVLPSEENTIETNFLRLFAGLETLLLDYRRKRSLEYILPEEKWSQLNAHIKKSLKSSNDIGLTKEERGSIYKKIGELNRYSLGEAYGQFCKHYGIDLSDLWPVFRQTNTVGLSEIRNKLIHGDPMPNSVIFAIGFAAEHLRFILERFLVVVMGGTNTGHPPLYVVTMAKRVPGGANCGRRSDQGNQYSQRSE